MLSYRKVEWVSALSMLGWALVLGLPGNSLGSKGLGLPYLQQGLGEASLAALMACAGASWCVALWINGHWRRSPVLRAASALVGALAWGQIALAYFYEGHAAGVFQPALANFVVLAAADALSAARSGGEAWRIFRADRGV